jgi:hypothetical protein
MALLMNQEPHVHIETRDPLRSPSNGQLLMEGPKEHVKARATEQILLLLIGARRRYFTPKAIVSLLDQKFDIDCLTHLNFVSLSRYGNFSEPGPYVSNK